MIPALVALALAIAPGPLDEVRAALSDRPWSALVELRSFVGDEPAGPARRLEIAWSPEGRRAGVRMSGLAAVATDEALLAWNPFNATAVYRDDAGKIGAADRLAGVFPPLLLPPLALALGEPDGGVLLVGDDNGAEPLSWRAVDQGAVGESRLVVLTLGFDESASWIERATVLVRSSPPVEHVLVFVRTDDAFGAPPMLEGRTQVERLGALAGRRGDLEPGDLLPRLALAPAGGEGVWSPALAFAGEGRSPSAVVLFVVRDAPGVGAGVGAGTGAEAVREARRTLARRSVLAGRPASAFPGVVARPVLAVPTGGYDAAALEAFAQAWRGMPTQPGFEEAEARTPGALWASPAELLDRVAPDAAGAVVVIGSQGRLDAVLPFDASVSAERLGVEIADAVGPDLIPRR